MMYTYFSWIDLRYSHHQFVYLTFFFLNCHALPCYTSHCIVVKCSEGGRTGGWMNAVKGAVGDIEVMKDSH